MAAPQRNDRLVTVFGGSGFLGRHVVRALAKRGWRIRAAVRRPDLAGHLQPMGRVGQIHAVQANVRYPDSLARALDGADAAVNLVGIGHESGRQTFDAVHRFGAGWVARAAREAGVGGLVHVSALGADPEAECRFARSKADGEAAVLEASPGATIVRPAALFGPEDDFFNRLAGVARLSPVVPLIGGGEPRLQPVFAGDVAEAVARALDGGAPAGEPYELGGPRIMRLREVAEFVLEATGRRRLLMPLPFGLAKVKAAFLQQLPRPPLTIDQVRFLERDNVVSETARATGRTLEGLAIQASPVEAVVPSYLVRFRKAGQFSIRLA